MDISGRAQLDLVSLANSYVDAVGNLQIAEVELARMADKGNAFSKTELSMAKIKVDTAQRKVKIFRSIAEAALESAKSDLDLASQQAQTGLAPKTAVTEAQSRLKILQVILAQ